jgi:protein phosphatase PTC2/3
MSAIVPVALSAACDDVIRNRDGAGSFTPTRALSVQIQRLISESHSNVLGSSPSSLSHSSRIASDIPSESDKIQNIHMIPQPVLRMSTSKNTGHGMFLSYDDVFGNNGASDSDDAAGPNKCTHPVVDTARRTKSVDSNASSRCSSFSAFSRFDSLTVSSEIEMRRLKAVHAFQQFKEEMYMHKQHRGCCDKPMDRILQANDFKLSDDQQSLWPHHRALIPCKRGFRIASSLHQGARTYFEDRHICKLADVSDHTDCGDIIAMFGVFDGHGGSQAAITASKQAFRIVMKSIADLRHILSMEHENHDDGHLYPLTKSETIEAVEEAFVDLEHVILDACDANKCSSGSTANIVLIQSQHIICANVGDSRSVLSRGGKAVDLSQDHKPERPDEKKRIEAANGHVRCLTQTVKRCYFLKKQVPIGAPRVWPGGIAVSRSLGDKNLKRPELGIVHSDEIIIPTPEVTITERCVSLNERERDEFIITATDGFWDVFDSQEAVTIVHRLMIEDDNITPKDVSDTLVMEARRRQSPDNITVQVCFFTH